MTYDTILFDLDGTLTDPQEGIVNCIVHALTQMNVKIPPRPAIKAHIGPPLRDAFAHFLMSTDYALIEQAITLYRERFATVGLYENEVYAEIPSLLELLHANGKKLILATSKPRIYAQQILMHFGLLPYFHAVYGSELDGTRDRKNELIAYIVSRHALDTSRTVMIGDRGVDMTGARSNGIAGIGVSWGYGTQDELTHAGARFVCTMPNELLQIIR